MISIAFDVKFYNKNEGMPPRACRPPKKTSQKSIGNQQMLVTQAPEHPQGSEFDTKVLNMSPEALAHPTGPQNIQDR